MHIYYLWAKPHVYETAAGRVRSTGPDEGVAPGRMRRIGDVALKRARAEYRRLLQAARDARSEASRWRRACDSD